MATPDDLPWTRCDAPSQNLGNPAHRASPVRIPYHPVCTAFAYGGGGGGGATLAIE